MAWHLPLLTGLDIVFHPKCHGVSKAHVARTPMMICSQHSCVMCQRNTGDAGGMLFRCVLPYLGASGIGADSCRCQTCPQAFCEDCLPEDDIDAIGDTIPELSVTSIRRFISWIDRGLFFCSLLLGYRTSATVYFIRCHDCQNDFVRDPSIWKSWQQEFAETEEKLRTMPTLSSF